MGCMADFTNRLNVPRTTPRAPRAPMVPREPMVSKTPMVPAIPKDLTPIINHVHPMVYEFKSNAHLLNCNICGFPKNEYSYSCIRECPFYICDTCAHLISNGTKLVVHEHPLCCELRYPKCKVCQRTYIDRANFICHAYGCRFSICPYCYIAEYQNSNIGRIM